MRYKFIISTFLVLAYLGYSCASIQSGKTSTSKDKSYSEDLSAYLPEIEDEQIIDEIDTATFVPVPDSSTADVTEKLNIVLDTVAAYSRSTINYIDGFTIQVYGGDDRALAKDFRMNIIRHFPETDPRTVFEQPNYKVRVGVYYTRLEAHQFFSEIKEFFPKAILIPTRIYIK